MKIALLGFNVENASAYDFLYERYPEARYTVYDQKPQPSRQLPDGVTFYGSQTTFEAIEADLVVRSPGISPRAITTDGKVVTATQLFFEHSPSRHIIGVTGSKGKGTISSLIAAILRRAGKTVHLVGNIGTPALAEIPKMSKDDVVVYELSSFQLWDLRQSPTTAVINIIEPDHLDVHLDMADYMEAKSHIAAYQAAGDRLLYAANNPGAARVAQLHQSSRHQGDDYVFPGQQSVYVKDGYFYAAAGMALGQRSELKLCSVSALVLPGAHNVRNATGAIGAALKHIDDKLLNSGELPTIVAKGLSDFHGLEHRLKFVREVGGVRYYDDSIATTPGSAIAALQAFTEQKVIILGGSYKGADFGELSAHIKKSNVKKTFLIGKEADRIEAALRGSGITNYENLHETHTMAQVVGRAQQASQSGDVVILSPAAASFGMFTDYKDRGRQFIAAVEQL